jgi:hypothetical protein
MVIVFILVYVWDDGTKYIHYIICVFLVRIDVELHETSPSHLSENNQEHDDNQVPTIYKDFRHLIQ